MHYPSPAFVVAAIATLATALPTDATPAHQLVRREDPICGFVSQAGTEAGTGTVPKIYGGGKCFTFSEEFHDATTGHVSKDQKYVVVFKDSGCEWCETFSNDNCQTPVEKKTRDKFTDFAVVDLDAVITGASPTVPTTQLPGFEIEWNSIKSVKC